MNCWMLKQRNGSIAAFPPDGGGNVARDNSVVVRRSAALGDCLAASCVSDKLIERGYSVVYQAHSGVHCILRRLKNRVAVAEPNGFAHCDLDNAYENDPQRRAKHFHQMFLDAANHQLHSRSINLGPALNCKPKMAVTSTFSLDGRRIPTANPMRSSAAGLEVGEIPSRDIRGGC